MESLGAEAARALGGARHHRAARVPDASVGGVGPAAVVVGGWRRGGSGRADEPGTLSRGRWHVPSLAFSQDCLPIFEQYAQTHSLWNPGEGAIAYPTRNEVENVDQVEVQHFPKREAQPGTFPSAVRQRDGMPFVMQPVPPAVVVCEGASWCGVRAEGVGVGAEPFDERVEVCIHITVSTMDRNVVTVASSRGGRCEIPRCSSHSERARGSCRAKVVTRAEGRAPRAGTTPRARGTRRRRGWSEGTMSRFRTWRRGGANLSSASTIAANDAPSRARRPSGRTRRRRPPLRPVSPPSRRRASSRIARRRSRGAARTSSVARAFITLTHSCAQRVRRRRRPRPRPRPRPRRDPRGSRVPSRPPR